MTAEFHHHAPEASVGEEEVAAPADCQHGDSLLPDEAQQAQDLFRYGGLDKNVGRASDPPGAMIFERLHGGKKTHGELVQFFR